MINYLEDSFAVGYKTSLECFVRLFATIHQTYVFEEVKRAPTFDDNYDIGNLLILVVHHAIALRIRRPDTTSLMIEDNLKIMYKMFTVESKVNQILDINSLYLTWLIMRDRKKDYDRRIVKLTAISSEGHIFLKGVTQYFIEMEFDLGNIESFPETKQFFLEGLLQEKLFDPFLSLDLSPISESDDYLDSIFVWEYYKGEVDPVEYLVLKFVMTLRAFTEVISVIHDTVDMLKLHYGQPTTRNVARIIHDSMSKMSLKVFKNIKGFDFDMFSQKFKESSPHLVAYVRNCFISLFDNLTELAKEVPYFGAILYYANKENVDVSMNRVLTSSLIAKLDIAGVSKLQADFIADISKMKKKLADDLLSK
jgi:hypothetical protein